jgi:signal transduction histidine kinase
MTVRTRLILTMTAIALLLVGPALYGMSRLAELRRIAEEIQGRHAAASLAVGRVQARLADLDRLQRSYIAAPSVEARDGMREALGQSRLHLTRLAEAGYGEVAREAAAGIDALEDGTARIERLVETGDVEAATVFFEDVRPMFARAQASLDVIATRIDLTSTAAVTRAERIGQAATTTMLLAIVIALALALLLGGWTTRALTLPLQRLSAGTSRVAGGEFEAPRGLPYERRDEIGELSRSFRAMALRLKELDRLKAEFISMASHDLKTPINVIGGYAELLTEGLYGEMPEKQREVLGSIQEQTVVLTRLVNQLLDISRLEAGGFRIETSEVRVAELVASVERTFDALARQKRVELSVVVEDSAPDVIIADPDRLRSEVLGNLLSNAFKFTPEGGSIEVRAQGGEDGLLEVTVRDTGVGIPAEDLPRIFEKFYQVGQDAKAAGSGLGLAIAREIVEAHGGTIDAESEPGRGTTFHVRLPAGRPAARLARR